MQRGEDLEYNEVATNDDMKLCKQLGLKVSHRCVNYYKDTKLHKVTYNHPGS